MDGVLTAFEIAGTAIQQVIEQEFAAEGFTAVFDNLHDAQGRYRVDIGIAPEEDLASPGNILVQETNLIVKFFNLWTDEISPDTIVDPRIITTYAERFRRALLASKVTTPSTEQVWWFDVRRVTFPDDPTGNKSRFWAYIRCFGNNAGVVETTG